jgi:hypothetical protein
MGGWGSYPGALSRSSRLSGSPPLHLLSGPINSLNVLSLRYTVHGPTYVCAYVLYVRTNHALYIRDGCLALGELVRRRRPMWEREISRQRTSTANSHSVRQSDDPSLHPSVLSCWASLGVRSVLHVQRGQRLRSGLLDYTVHSRTRCGRRIGLSRPRVLALSSLGWHLVAGCVAAF